MKQYLPIGSVVSLKNNENGQKILITSRVPILEIRNKVGYFDYGGCPFPQGEMESNFYFNDEDIKKVDFYGFTDKHEDQIQIKIEDGKKTFRENILKLKN